LTLSAGPASGRGFLQHASGRIERLDIRVESSVRGVLPIRLAKEHRNVELALGSNSIDLQMDASPSELALGPAPGARLIAVQAIGAGSSDGMASAQ
jgi:hypothetical protein